MVTATKKEIDNRPKTEVKRYDWEEISAEYIQGYFLTDPETGVRKHLYPTLEDLISKYGMFHQTISKKSREDKWVLKRQVFRSKIKEHITDRQVSTFLSESAQHDALTLDKVRKLHKLLDYHLRQYSEILDGDFQMEYDAEVAVNLRDLETATKMLTSMHNLVRSVVGEPINSTDRADLVRDLTALNPALTESSTTDRKKKIKELQDKLNLTASQKKAMNKITSEAEENES